MASNVFFSPLPRAGATTTTTFSQDRSALFSSSEQFPITPQRKLGSKTPFGFKSPAPVLFASPSCSSQQQPGSVFSPRSRKGKQDGVESLLTSPRPDLGYFAFPPESPPSLSSSGTFSNNAAATTDRVAHDGLSWSGHNPTKPKFSSDPTPPSTPTKSRTSNGSASTRQQPPSPPSRVLEQAEAERGEEEWVSRGGMLRDRFGHVDVARTKKVREEVERKVREKVLRERWEAYEDGWRRLIERCGGPGNKGKAKAKDNEEGRNDTKDVRFTDIPWPVWVEDRKEEKPKFTMSINHSLNGAFSRSQASFISGKNKDDYTLQDLTIDRIEDFLISPLSIRGTTETPKNRVRRSYLRWHPDKLGWLIDRVKDEDVDDVKAGVGTVLECLRRMNAKFRAPADSELLRSQAGTPGSSCSASGSSSPGD